MVLYPKDSTQKFRVSSVHFYGLTYDPYVVNYTVDRHIDGYFQAADIFSGYYYFWFNNPDVKFGIKDNDYKLIYDQKDDMY